MGLLPFCVASLFFFTMPSVMLLSASTRRWLFVINSVTNIALLSYAFWLFPQISRESLALTTLMFDLYCYLVFSVGIVTGSVVKAIELKYFQFIFLVFISLAVINLSAMLYSGWF